MERASLPSKRSEMLDGATLYDRYTALEARFERHKNEADAAQRRLVDECEGHIAARAHLLSRIDRLRWCISLCRNVIPKEQWTEDMERFADS